MTEYAIPTTSAVPEGIIAGSDGRMWFTEYGTSKIGAVTTSGTFQEFGTLFGSDGPELLTNRGDGSAWYAAAVGNHIGYQGMTNGIAGETSSPTAGSAPYGIAGAADNNLYFTEQNAGKIARISNLFGTITELSLPAGAAPTQIVRGPDGNVWFTDLNLSTVGVVYTSSFSVTNFPTATPNAVPMGIVVGADGALWFTESGLDRIGRMTTSGATTEYASPQTALALKGIAVANDGSLWFAEPSNVGTPHIGKLVY